MTGQHARRWGPRALLALVALAGVLAAVGLVGWAVVGAAPPGQALASSEETIVSGGMRRTYRLFVPSGYRPGVPTPLVLSLHGQYLSGGQQERLSGMSEAAERAGILVVYPQASGWPPRWRTDTEDGQDDVRFLLDLIDHLAGRFGVDPARVYAAGISNGAQIAHRLGCTGAERVAGLGLVAGGEYEESGPCEPTRPLPIVAFHGTADTVLPYDGEDGGPSILAWAAGWAARNGCADGPTVTLQQGSATARTWGGCREDASVTLYTIQGGGHSWPGTGVWFWSSLTTADVDATAVMLEFFAAHPRR